MGEEKLTEPPLSPQQLFDQVLRGSWKGFAQCALSISSLSIYPLLTLSWAHVFQKLAVHEKDQEKSLKSNCLTKTYKKTSHSSWTLSIQIRVICLYNLHNKFEVHVVWLDFFLRWVNHFNLERFLHVFCNNVYFLLDINQLAMYNLPLWLRTYTAPNFTKKML